MPVGTCVECGQEEVLGPVPDEGCPFLCCDCDSEMAAYTKKDRSDMKRASRERMEKLVMQPGAAGTRSSMLESARTTLQQSAFDALGEEGSSIKILTDKEQDFFAGMGSSEVGPCCVSLAAYLAEILTEAPATLLELGAGIGAPGIWAWKKFHPNLTVCLTDVPRLVPLLKLNCEANFALVNMTHKPLRWGVPADAEAIVNEGVVYDYVIGADACYNDDKSYPLMETIQKLNPRKAAIFAQSVHPEHQTESHQAIEALCQRATEAGWEVEPVKETQTGVMMKGEEYLCVILKMSPPRVQTGRRSRHSKFDIMS